MASLEKTIGVWRGTALMLNIVLGAGLLTLPGLAYQNLGGGAIWVWIGCATAAIPLLVVFALLGRKFASAGGIPEVARNVLGEDTYRACTFLFFGAVALGLPAIALTGGYYASAIVGGDPHALAAMILLSAVSINFLSADMAGRVNTAIASGLVFVLGGIAIAGFLAVSGNDPSVSRELPEVSNAVFLATFMTVFFAFTGWEVATHLSEEFRNPERDIPIAMFLSFIIAVALYLSLAGVVSLSNIESGFEAPFSAIFSKAFGKNVEIFVSGVAVLLIFANLSAAIWAVSRMVFSASRTGLIPRRLSKTTSGAPQAATLATTVCLCITISLSFIGKINISSLLEYAGQNFLILYGIASFCLLVTSSNSYYRVAGSLGCIVVVSILYLRPAGTYLYPASIVVIALVGRYFTRDHAKAEEAELYDGT